MHTYMQLSLSYIHRQSVKASLYLHYRVKNMHTHTHLLPLVKMVVSHVISFSKDGG